jgi:cell wall-associated NlpC family hydrolase
MEQHIIQEARCWIGTAFHHQGRVKARAQQKGGCDCIGLILGVADALSIRSRQDGALLSAHDVAVYHHAFPPPILLQLLQQHLIEVPVADAKPGDVAVFAMSQRQYHLGILTQYHSEAYGLIHAMAQAKQVVEHRLDAIWQEKFCSAFRYTPVEGIPSWDR